ncbi:unnamed protein product [Effrenium voratum]|nr:unnamed protein product [Effrenium voratum]
MQAGSPQGFLTSSPVLRRGEQAWVANLAEGSRHYCYPVHLSGSFAFAPTQAANLYLLLCRFFTWNFPEAAASASTVSEISTSEERQIWERLCLVASAAHHPDCAAACLRLSLATQPYSTVATRWDTSQLLLEYVRKRPLSASCRLKPEEELQLLISRCPEGARLLPELAQRRQALQDRPVLVSGELPGLRALKLELHLSLGAFLLDDGFDRASTPVCDKTFTEEVGFFERDVTYNRPEKSHLSGVEAMSFLDGLFSMFGGVARLGQKPGLLVGYLKGKETSYGHALRLDFRIGPAANAAFPLLYELFTATMTVEARKD